jgi:hypothetical protein
MVENSPALSTPGHGGKERRVPKGRLKWPLGQSSLRDLFIPNLNPGVETPGYYHLSLRDRDRPRHFES